MAKQTELEAKQAEYEEAARRVIGLCGELQGAIADMRTAARAVPVIPGPVGPGWASRIAGVVAATLQSWRRAEPVPFGDPPLLTPREQAIRECKRDLALARKRLEWAKEMAARPELSQGEGRRLVETHTWAVDDTAARLAYLETGAWPPPKGPTQDDIFAMPLAEKLQKGFARPRAPMPAMPFAKDVQP